MVHFKIKSSMTPLWLALFILLTGFNFLNQKYIRAAENEPLKKSFRISTYNINHGWGTEEWRAPQCTDALKTRLDKIIQEVKTINPDIITFQEIDRGTWFSCWFDEYDYFVEKLGYHYSYYGKKWVIGRAFMVHQWGNAIFSKFELTEFKNLQTPPNRFQNYLIGNWTISKVIAETPLGKLAIYFTHLNPRSEKHREKSIKEIIFDEETRLSVIVGDLNSPAFYSENGMEPFGSIIKLLLEDSWFFPESIAGLVNNSNIDHIVTSEGLIPENCQLKRVPLSDHKGIITCTISGND